MLELVGFYLQFKCLLLLVFGVCVCLQVAQEKKQNQVPMNNKLGGGNIVGQIVCIFLVKNGKIFHSQPWHYGECFTLPTVGQKDVV